MISFKNVSYFIKSQLILSNISFTIKNKEKVLITGMSGCGKSTLLNLLIKNIAPSSGKIFFNKEDINQFNSNKTNKYKKENVVMISQFDDLFDELTVFENLVMFYYEKDVLDILKKANLLFLKDQYVFNLSGGERQRISIIKACLSVCDVLLCDEITSALDKENAIKIIDFVMKLFKDKTIIYVSHDKSIFKDNIDHYIYIENHKIKEDIIINDINYKKTKKINKSFKSMMNISLKNGIKKLSISSLLIYLCSIFSVFIFLSFDSIFQNIAKNSYRKYFDYNVVVVKDNENIVVDNIDIFYNISNVLNNSDTIINNSKIKNVNFKPFYNENINEKIVINDLFLKKKNIENIKQMVIKNNDLEILFDEVLIINENNMFTSACIYYDIKYFSLLFDGVIDDELIIINYDFTLNDDRFTNNPLFFPKQENKAYIDSDSYHDYLTFKMVYETINEIMKYFFTIIFFFSLVSLVLINYSKMLKDVKQIAIFLSRGYSSFHILFSYLFSIFIYSSVLLPLIIYIKEILLSLIIVDLIYILVITITYYYFKNKKLIDLLKEETIL